VVITSVTRMTFPKRSQAFCADTSD
jgi:hypothetical protein